MVRDRAVARPGLGLAVVLLSAGGAGCGLALGGVDGAPREARQAAWVASLREDKPSSGASPSAPAACIPNEEAAVAAALTQSPSAARFEGQARYLMAQAEVSPADAPALRLGNLRLDRLLHGPERAELALRVPIARPGTIDGERQLVRAEAGVAQARAQLERVRLALEVREAWARLDHAHRRAAVAEDLARRHHGASEAGTLPELTAVDQQAASAETLRAEAELAARHGEVARWREALTALVGAPLCGEPSPVVLEGAGVEGAAEGEPADGGDLLDGALRRRAELDRLYAEREQAEVAQALAEREAWPWFEWVQFGYEVDRGFFPDTFGFALSVSLPWSAWDGAAAEAERVRMRAIDEEARRWVAQIDGEVGTARRELEARLEQVKRLEALVAAMPVVAIDGLRSAAPTEVLAADLLALHRDRARLLGELADARLEALLSRARLFYALGR